MKKYFFIMIIFILALSACTNAKPKPTPPPANGPIDVEDLGGKDEGGAMGEMSDAACQAKCDNLEKEINQKLEERAREIIRSADCNIGPPDEGATKDFAGTIFSSETEYNCPNQTLSEKLGQAVADAKANPTKKDKEINKLKQEYADNCPCMVRVKQCVVCEGVEPGGLCPTYFVTSKEECDKKGGEITVE